MFNGLKVGDSVVMTSKDFIKDKNSMPFSQAKVKKVSSKRIYIAMYDYSFDKKTGLRVLRKNEGNNIFTNLYLLNDEMNKRIKIARVGSSISNTISSLIYDSKKNFNNLSIDELESLEKLLIKLKR